MLRLWLLLLPGLLLALEPEEARFLLARTGFGWSPAEVERLLPLDRQAAVDLLLAAPDETIEPPTWVAEPEGWRSRLAAARGNSAAAEAARMVLNRERRQRLLAFQAWWAERLLLGASPQVERLVLHWHGHFTSSHRTVREPMLLWNQHLALRQHARGSFRDLLGAMARDSAMLIYLDGVRNAKRAPNENFAREVMELFTLGEGNYTEADIREAARACTGWVVDREDGEVRFVAQRFDAGEKTVLGRPVRSLDDLCDLLVAQPACADHLACRFWNWYCGGDPDPEALTAVAVALRRHGSIRDGVAALWTSEAFWAPAQRGARIKDPAELIIGTLRLTGYTRIEGRVLVRTMADLGMELLAPPTVQGWPGGTLWIEPRTLLLRRQTLLRLSEAMDASQHPQDLPACFTIPPTRVPTDFAAALLDPAYQVH